MIFPFRGQISLTQDWGNKLIINGVDIYGQWGLKGHNGTDWGTATGTAIIAPHDGKIIECGKDPSGYGIYVKIENSKWGSILAHLREWIVKVGDSVSEGQTVGYSNNTGNSTGPHLHWGLYPIPRNKNNGYSGTVDPFQYIGDNMQDDEMVIKKSIFEELVSKSSKYDEFTKIGYGSAAEVTFDIQDRNKSIEHLKADLVAEEGRANTARDTYNDLLALVAKTLSTQQEENQVEVALEKVSDQLDELDDLRRNFATLQLDSGKQVEELNAEVARLKAMLSNDNVLEKAKMEEILAEIIKRLKNILKRG